MTARRSRQDDARRDESGVSLPEMAVALFVLAVGIAGAASMFVAAAATTAATEHRSAMERRVVSELQATAALDDDVLGISPAAPDYRPSHDGRRTVSEPGAVVDPLEVDRIAGVEATIRRDVTWASASTGSVTVDDAYKLVTVTITWTDRSGDHEVVASSAALGSVLPDDEGEAP